MHVRRAIVLRQIDVVVLVWSRRCTFLRLRNEASLENRLLFYGRGRRFCFTLEYFSIIHAVCVWDFSDFSEASLNVIYATRLQYFLLWRQRRQMEIVWFSYRNNARHKRGFNKNIIFHKLIPRINQNRKI